ASGREEVCARRTGGGDRTRQHDRLDESALTKLAEDAEGRDPTGWGSDGLIRQDESLELVSANRPERREQTERRIQARGRGSGGSSPPRIRVSFGVVVASASYAE